jgi:hypothetical protein
VKALPRAAKQYQFIAQASTRRLGTEGTGSNLNPTIKQLNRPLATSRSITAVLELSQPFSTQPGILYSRPSWTPDQTSAQEVNSFTPRQSGYITAPRAEAFPFSRNRVDSAPPHLGYLAAHTAHSKLTAFPHFRAMLPSESTCQPTTCDAFNRLLKLSYKNLGQPSISLVHLPCPTRAHQDRSPPFVPLFTHPSQDTGQPPSGAATSSPYPRHLPRQDRISTHRSCMKAPRTAARLQTPPRHHQLCASTKPAPGSARRSLGCPHLAQRGAGYDIAMYTDRAPCFSTHRQWHTDPRWWHCQPHMHMCTPPSRLSMSTVDCGIEQLSLVLLSGDVEKNPGPLVSDYIAYTLAYVLTITVDLPVLTDTVSAAIAGIHLLLLSLVATAPATCHRGGRPQRAKLRKRLSHTTARCVRYTAHTTWWRHCHHKHSMWVPNPFSCTDGTFASRYKLRTLARAGLTRPHSAYIPGATQTHHRFMPLVSVHLKAEPQSATHPPREPRVPHVTPSPTGRSHTTSKPTTSNDRPMQQHQNAAVRIGGGPKHANRVKSAATEPETTHTSTVPQGGLVTLCHSHNWTCIVNPRGIVNAVYMHSMLWQAVKLRTALPSRTC